MKIGLDARVLQEAQPSGIGEYTRNLFSHLLPRLRQHDVFLFWNGFSSAQPSIWSGKDFSHVHHRAFQVPNKIFHASQWAFRMPLIDRMLGGVDVFFLPNWHFSSFSSRVFLVSVIHDLSFVHLPDCYSVKSRLWHSAVQARGLYARSDRVICDSRFTQQDVIATWGGDIKKTHVVYPGVDQIFDRIFSEDIDRVKKKYTLTKRYFLSSGTLEPRKNLVAALRAFYAAQPNLPLDVEFLLAGKPGYRAKVILELAKKIPRVRYLGYVPSQDRPALFAGSECVVYPSVYEGFGLPPVEALRAGTRVIAAAATSLPEVLEEHAVYINPTDESTITQAFVEIMEHPDTSERKNQRRSFSQKYSWDHSAAEVAKLLKSA